MDSTILEGTIGGTDFDSPENGVRTKEGKEIVVYRFRDFAQLIARHRAASLLRQAADFLVKPAPPPKPAPPTLRKYVIRPAAPLSSWAIILIDTSHGFFATVSDYGNYAYNWSNPGCEFRKFLTELEPTYLHGKLMHGRRDRQVYDQQATLKAVREYFVQEGKDVEKEMEDINSADFNNLHDDYDFRTWIDEKNLYGEVEHLHCTMPNPESWAFCTKLFPTFQMALRKELEEEVS